MRPFYVTTAIDYPNGAPHIGHAYEKIATDAIARFKRLDGFDVRFLTGTDEHGLKMAETAAAEGVPTAQLARRNSDVFQRLDDRLNVSYDRFIRTTDSDHLEASKVIWQRMFDAGDIYLGTYSGWYSVRDENFVSEDETRLAPDGTRVVSTPAHRSPGPRSRRTSSGCRRTPTSCWLTIGRIRSSSGPTCAATRWSASCRAGCATSRYPARRSTGACQVPDHPDHVMYVWVDALTNYLTGVGFPDTDSDVFRRFWPADLHMIGKDIIRFHAVYWPAFLMSAGIELPRRVFAHGHLLNRGEKMSKSVGNVVDPIALIDEFGVDQVRYFLLREVPFGQDGSYSEEAIISRINADLANELGNLAQRSLSMVAKNLDGVVPEPAALTDDDRDLLAAADGLLARGRRTLRRAAMHLALEAIWLVLGAANKYFSAQEPWVLRKSESESDQARFATVLYTTLEVVRIAALLVQPVMPDSAAKLLDLLGQPADARSFAAIGTRLVPGTVLPAPTGVFPRYQVK